MKYKEDKYSLEFWHWIAKEEEKKKEKESENKEKVKSKKKFLVCFPIFGEKEKKNKKISPKNPTHSCPFLPQAGK